MKPDERFLKQPKYFWANIRTLTEKLGYSRKGLVVSYTIEELARGLESLHLGSSHIWTADDGPTPMGRVLIDYFAHRAAVLNTHVQPRLMDLDRARQVFTKLLAQQPYHVITPMNKQSSEKRAPNYFTGIVNMLVEANLGDIDCNYNPLQLTTVTQGGMPLRTLARRIDGACPSVVSPIAVWEIKEYYFTRTFGSRVSGGVYETMLDGLELEELREAEGIDIKHYLMIDGYPTWWDMGKSYLCRIIDMLHMGYVDEVLFGYEVVEQLPRIAGEWRELVERRPLL